MSVHLRVALRSVSVCMAFTFWGKANSPSSGFRSLCVPHLPSLTDCRWDPASVDDCGHAVGQDHEARPSLANMIHLFRRREVRLAARAARTFSNVLRERSNVLRSGMADGSSRLDHHAVLLGVPLLLIGSGALLTTLGRTVPRAPAEVSSTAVADLTKVAEAADVGATCDTDEEGGLQVSGGSLEDVYEVGDVLGRGHFAVVTSGRHRVTGETVAIKTIKKGSQNVRSEVSE